MSGGDIAGLIAAGVFALLVLLLAVPIVKLGKVFDEVRTAIRSLSDGATPELNVQFKMPMGAHITAGYDGKLYFTQKQELWAAPLK